MVSIVFSIAYMAFSIVCIALRIVSIAFDMSFVALAMVSMVFSIDSLAFCRPRWHIKWSLCLKMWFQLCLVWFCSMWHSLCSKLHLMWFLVLCIGIVSIAFITVSMRLAWAL